MKEKEHSSSGRRISGRKSGNRHRVRNAGNREEAEGRSDQEKTDVRRDLSPADTNQTYISPDQIRVRPDQPRVHSGQLRARRAEDANGHADSGEAEKKRRRKIRADRKKKRRRRRRILTLTLVAAAAAASIGICRAAVRTGGLSGDHSETSVSGVLTAENVPIEAESVTAATSENVSTVSDDDESEPLYSSVYEAIDSIEETDALGAVAGSGTGSDQEAPGGPGAGGRNPFGGTGSGDNSDSGEEETPLYGYGEGNGFSDDENDDASSDVSDAISGFGGMELTDTQKNQIASALNELAGYSVGFILCDINDRSGIVYNPDETYYSASSVKGPYVASVVSMYPDCLDDWETEIENILIYSDNNSYEELRIRYGDEPIEQWAEDAGTQISFRQGWDYTYYSARTLAKLWMKNYEFFESGDDGSEIAELYEEPDTSAINSALGSKYTTRSKAGWIADTDMQSTVDAGIIYADNGPYVLAVLTDIPSNMDELEPLIKVLDSIHSTM